MSDHEPPGLPSPNDRGSSAAESRSRASRVRSIEECLQALDQLAGMIALGIIRPAQANAIRGVLHEIIAQHRQAATSDASVAALDGDLLARLREDPSLMNLLEPLLTTDQIATLLGGSSDDRRA
jgi:hypothetical protein